MEGTEYITLKEAAELSGYSPDYIGQLIRRGRIPGKQVYANVAWMTTRGALSEYIARKEKKAPGTELLQDPPVPEMKSNAASSDQLTSEKAKEIHLITQGWEWLFRVVAGTTIVICVVSLLLLLYIFSVVLDHRMEARTLEHLSASETLEQL